MGVQCTYQYISYPIMACNSAMLLLTNNLMWFSIFCVSWMRESYLKKRRNQTKVLGKVNLLAHKIIWRYRVARTNRTFLLQIQIYWNVFSGFLKKDLPKSMKLKLKGGGIVDPDSGLDHKAHVLKVRLEFSPQFIWPSVQSNYINLK